MLVSVSCPVCDPHQEADSLTVRVSGRRREEVDADVIRCDNGCVLSQAQSDYAEQKVIDAVLSGDLCITWRPS